MIWAFCPTCRADRAFKKHVGIGTGLGALFTGGISLLGAPFYPERCVVCGGSYYRLGVRKRGSPIGWALLALIVGLILKAILGPAK